MDDTLTEFAGFYAAHGLWCLSDADGPFTPMFAFEKLTGERQMVRLFCETLEEGVQRGHSLLFENPNEARHSLLIYDGLFKTSSGKKDALIIEAVQYFPERLELTMGIPYRASSNGFAVFPPRFISVKSHQVDYQAFAAGFFRGLSKHEKGAEIWRTKLEGRQGEVEV